MMLSVGIEKDKRHEIWNKLIGEDLEIKRL